MKILHLNLYRKYFDAILKGEKTTEYREVTPYWSKRLEGRHYDVIKFRNGYRKDAPEHFKTIGVQEHVPEDLAVAIETFLAQAIIIGENKLDFMPPEYLQNLLEVMSKYPEYNKVTLDLIKILKKGNIIE